MTPIVSLVIQADGKIVIGGWFSIVEGVARNHIARLHSDGTLDSTFNPNANESIDSIAIQTNGKIAVGGEFTAIGGVARNHIARLHSDGTLDSTFNPNANGPVASLAFQADGQILVAGRFTAIGGVARKGIARLTNRNPALQNFRVSSSGNEINWMRSMASPELLRVTFEDSRDGINWSMLGNGSMIPGGWELKGLSLPANQNHYVRAMGYARNGSFFEGSSSYEAIKIIFCTSDIYVTVGGDCGGKTPCYNSIQNAVNAASTGSLIRISGGTYTESITLNAPKVLILQGGWDATFSAQTSATRLTLAPKAPQGSLTLQMLTIRP